MNTETIISILAALISLVGGFVSVLFARKAMLKKEETGYDYARSLLESSLDPLVTISPEGKIIDVNDATISVTGLRREALIGTDFSDYFTEPEKARKGYQKVLNEGFVRDYELTLKSVKGDLTPVLYNASVYRNHFGQIQGVFAAARDITEIVKLKNKLHQMALYDDLTGLANRKLLEDKWKFLVAEARRNKQKIVVAFLDINKFKYINDTYGHAVGDDLLKWFSNRLGGVIRESDVVSRIGGDEFVILFYGTLNDPNDYIEKINHSISSLFQVRNEGGDKIEITTSVGVSVYPDDSDTFETLLKMADSQMYENKKKIT